MFRHFPTKDALIEATLVRPLDRLGQAAATMPAAAMTLDRAVELAVRGLAPART